jgi:hypothetical protein
VIELAVAPDLLTALVELEHAAVLARLAATAGSPMYVWYLPLMDALFVVTAIVLEDDSS